MEHIFQIITNPRKPITRDKVYYFRDSSNQIIATTNPEIVLGKLCSMSTGDKAFLEIISQREYQERVAIDHSFDVTNKEA